LQKLPCDTNIGPKVEDHKIYSLLQA
jgi:hypothetical protein